MPAWKGLIMVKKKICMLGAFAVGKTSLVRRFVESVFSDRYQTTVGVKIDKKSLELEGRRIDLIIWDLNGEDEFQSVRLSYLRGSSGCIYVVDGTRADTVDTAENLFRKTTASIGPVPSLLVVNKHDLEHQWEVGEQALASMGSMADRVVYTSARTGLGVDEAFVRLATMMMGDGGR